MDTTSQEFWDTIDQLVKGCSIVIDRPRGTKHPRYPDLVYPLDYGYLDGTSAADGGGIDVWVGSLKDRAIESLAVSVDLEKRDAEIKILIGCAQDEEQIIDEFLNNASMRALIVNRDQPGLSLLTTRHSVRIFTTQPVPAELLESIVEIAGWAPSSHNRQPWRFAVITSAEIKMHLADAMGSEFRQDLIEDGIEQREVDSRVERSRQRIREAPAAIVLCLDQADLDEYPDPERQNAEYTMGVQSVAMAGQNLLLAAHANGLGSVWVCAPLFAQQAVRESLDLPEGWDPQGLILLGYPAKAPTIRPRRSISELARFY